MLISLTRINSDYFFFIAISRFSIVLKKKFSSDWLNGIEFQRDSIFYKMLKNWTGKGQNFSMIPELDFPTYCSSSCKFYSVGRILAMYFLLYINFSDILLCFFL